MRTLTIVNLIGRGEGPMMGCGQPSPRVQSIHVIEYGCKLVDLSTNNTIPTFHDLVGILSGRLMLEAQEAGKPERVTPTSGNMCA